MEIAKNQFTSTIKYQTLHNNPNHDHIPETTVSKKHLLFVEDDMIIQNIISITLSNDFDITVANSGEEAWNYFQQKSFDIVLTDIGLPGISGFELAERIRKKSKNLPIIAISAHADSKDVRKKLQKIGMNEILTKPVRNDILINTTLYWADKKLSG